MRVLELFLYMVKRVGRLFAATPAFAMPLPPASGGAPNTTLEVITLGPQATAGSDLTTEGPRANRKCYLTAARMIPVGAATADATNKRTWTVVDQTTHQVTDGCIVDPASAKGAWLAATAYTTGQWVTLNNLMYVCIVNVTGGTGPGVDTSHWQEIAAAGLNYVNTITAAPTGSTYADFLGAAISDSGNTNIAASSKLGVQPTPQTTNTADVQQTQPAKNAAIIVSPSVKAWALPLNTATGAAAPGTAVITRTVTFEASRTLATFTCSTVSLVAGTEIDLTLDTADTAIYADDVLKIVSTHVASGVADPGGEIQLELAAYGDGAD